MPGSAEQQTLHAAACSVLSHGPWPRPRLPGDLELCLTLLLPTRPEPDLHLRANIAAQSPLIPSPRLSLAAFLPSLLPIWSSGVDLAGNILPCQPQGAPEGSSSLPRSCQPLTYCEVWRITEPQIELSWKEPIRITESNS